MLDIYEKQWVNDPKQTFRHSGRSREVLLVPNETRNVPKPNVLTSRNESTPIISATESKKDQLPVKSQIPPEAAR